MTEWEYAQEALEQWRRECQRDDVPMCSPAWKEGYIAAMHDFIPKELLQLVIQSTKRDSVPG